MLSVKLGRGGGWQGKGNNDPIPHWKVKKPPGKGASQLPLRSSEKRPVRTGLITLSPTAQWIQEEYPKECETTWKLRPP